MKTKRIKIPPQTIKTGSTKFVRISSISAYAIEYFDTFVNGLGNYQGLIQLQKDGIDLTAKTFDLDTSDVISMTIYYHGIRDYSELFYSVTDHSMRKRLAQFYEDSEKCFEAGAWLPFCLMCGGVFEGLLISKGMTGGMFVEKIDSAKDSGIIDQHDADVMHKVRVARNLVHANKHSQSYVDRTDAMDVRTTLDKLIDKF